MKVPNLTFDIPKTHYGSLVRAVEHINSELKNNHNLPPGVAIVQDKAYPLTLQKPAGYEATISFNDIFLVWELAKHFGYILGKVNP